MFKVGVIMQDKGDTAKAKPYTSRLSVNTLVLMALNRHKTSERDVMHNTRPEVALFLVCRANHKQLSDLHRNFCCAQAEISNICRRCHGISNKPKATKSGSLAQLVEQLTFNQLVAGRILHDPPIAKVEAVVKREGYVASATARRARRSRVILHDPH